MITLTNDNFAAEVSEGLVLVDFWAPWCGPCKMMLPIMEDLAKEPDVKVCKLNVDDSPELSQKYSISSIPTFIFFKNGQPVKTINGAKPKAVFQEAMAELK